MGRTNVSSSIISKPLHESHWILSRSKLREGDYLKGGGIRKGSKMKPDPVYELEYHTDSYAAKFACLAMLELGSSCNVEPDGLSAVMAVSSANSIYIASPCYVIHLK